MKDIDDIYDMENYDSDDSPGEFTIVVIVLHCYFQRLCTAYNCGHIQQVVVYMTACAYVQLLL